MVKNNINYIEGSGFIAKKFKKYSSFFKKNNCILYAAGVSNSLQNKKKEFEREIQRINKFIKINKKKIIYVSTYSIFDKSRNHKYVKNKIKIEKIIKKKVEKYIIFRLPEVVGSNKNPNTLVNFLYKKIKKRKKFYLWINAKRNLIDIDDVVKFIIFFIKLNQNKNKVINLLNPNFNTPIDIVNELEIILNKKAIYKIKKLKNYKFEIKNHINRKILQNMGFKFGNKYLYMTLKKYFR
tara:strand:+ start:918 stop:1631 length:714 start_codon:yes stop_codon:yes gene_type:complete